MADAAKTRQSVLVATTGLAVARAGFVLLGFGLIGLAYVRFVLPRLNRAMGFPAWHEGRWARRWNYGIAPAVTAVGALTIVVGLIAAAAGWSFG